MNRGELRLEMDFLVRRMHKDEVRYKEIEILLRDEEEDD